MHFEKLHQLYESGDIIGAIVDSPDLAPQYRKQARYERDVFIGDCEKSPFFGDIYEDIDLLADKEGLALPVVEVLKERPKALDDVQQTGDCYSHSTRAIIDISRKNEKLNGIPHSYIEDSATCLIYALRGHRGEGMTAYAVMNALKKGILLEQEYQAGNKTYDIRDYKYYWQYGAGEWANRGVPPEILAEAAKYPIGDIGLVETMEEVRAGLFAGYAFSCGSSINPGRNRNEYGIVGLQRSPIAHAMAIVGVDTTKRYHRENLYIWDNSWPPNFYSGSGYPLFEELGLDLKCHFVLTESDTWRAVRQKGTIAVSIIGGFPTLQLPDLGTLGRI